MADNFDYEFEKALFYLAKSLNSNVNPVKPIFFHCVRLSTYLYCQGYNSNVCIAALLHDILEDTATQKKELQKQYDSVIVGLISANTKNYKIDDKKKQLDELLFRCVNHNESAAIIKAADIIDNLHYFRKIEKQDAIKKLTYMGKKLLSIKPVSYQDPIFDTLRREIENGEKNSSL